MNLTILTGRVTADPVLKKAEGERVYTSFILAVPRQKKVPEADFPKITAYGKTAENICRCLHKNSKVIIRGKVRTRNIIDSEGIRQTLTEILVSNWEFSDTREFSDTKPNNSGDYAAASEAVEEEQADN